MEGELNRTKAELAEALGLTETRPFVAEKAYQAGAVIVHGGKVFISQQTICQGEKVRPGENCTETTTEDVINMLKEQEGE